MKTPNKKHSSSRDFFLYGLVFVVLYMAAISLGGLIFQVINLNLPDAAVDYYNGSRQVRDLLRGFASTLIVALPVLYTLMLKLRRERRVAKLALPGIRRWLTYITLLVASVVAIGDIVGIVHGYLGGELALRALLKMLTVLMITAAVIGYFLLDVKDASRQSRQMIVAHFMGVVAVAALVYAFVSVGSPAQNRLRAFDQRRVDGLSMMANCTENYWQNFGELPESIETATKDCGRPQDFKDPVSGAPYEYRVVNEMGFELCANFDLEDQEGGSLYFGDRQWGHTPGRTCFDKKAPPLPGKFSRPVPAL